MATTTNDKNQILEPIAAVSKLILLAFKPKNTKIAIRDHNVVLCEPKNESGYWLKIPQGVDRYWNGDSREDIYILNHVLCNFIEWYITPYKDTDPDIHKGLINMAKYLRVGLKELQTTYRSGNAVGTLQYYIVVLTAVIEGWFYPDMLYNPTSSERKSFLDDDRNDPDSLIYSTIFDIDKFKHFWTKDELRSLCSQFDKCFRNPDEPDTVVFKDEEADELTLDDTIVSQKSDDGRDQSAEASSSGVLADLLVQPDVPKPQKRTLKTTIRGNVVNHTRAWPVPKTQSNVIVQGHLVGIANILTMMDKRFTAMLNQSVKGTH